MDVLAAPAPSQPPIGGFTGRACRGRLPDPQPPRRRTAAPGLVVKSTDPAAAHIIIAISPEHLMHLIDQFHCVAPMYLIACSREQLEKVANGKCIGPEVSLRTQRSRRQAGSRSEFRHQLSRYRTCVIRNHFAIPSVIFGQCVGRNSAAYCAASSLAIRMTLSIRFERLSSIRRNTL